MSQRPICRVCGADRHSGQPHKPDCSNIPKK